MRRQNAKRKVEEETQNKKKEIKVIHEHVVISTLSEIDPLPRIEKVKKAIDRERLVKLLEDTFHYSLAFSEKLVEEYIYFIALFLVAHEEEFLECITPPPKIDFAWKEHISDTKVYLEFCKKLKVEFLDRTVDLTVRDKDHAEQIKKTKRIMESWTGGSVSMDVWNLEDMRKLKGVDIHILHSGGSTIIPFNACFSLNFFSNFS